MWVVQGVAADEKWVASLLDEVGDPHPVMDYIRSWQHERLRLHYSS
jgi:hypothetical protein